MTSITKLDSKPIYLGYQADQKKYCFYAIKQGVPRFLSYIQYFFWDRGPQTALALKEIPSDIEQELIKFLEGSIGYEFFKQRKNSKEQTVRKIFKLPEQFGSEAPVELQGVVVSGRTGRTKSGLSGGRSSVPERPPEPNETAPERHASRLRHASLSSDPAPDVPRTPMIEAPPKKIPEPRKPKGVVVDIQMEEPERVISKDSKLGDKMRKALDKLNKSDVVEPVVEVKPKRNKSMKVSEPLIIEPKEALATPKRGRPKNVTALENPCEVVNQVMPESNGKSKRPDVNVKLEKLKPRKPKST